LCISFSSTMNMEYSLLYKWNFSTMNTTSIQILHILIYKFSSQTGPGMNKQNIHDPFFLQDGPGARIKGADLDNRWVVPYNPFLLMRYNPFLLMGNTCIACATDLISTLPYLLQTKIALTILVLSFNLCPLNI
jgi:hypothetical protein